MDRRRVFILVITIALLAPLPAAAVDLDSFWSWLIPDWLVAADSTGSAPPDEEGGGATTSGGDASGCIDPNGAPTPCKPKP